MDQLSLTFGALSDPTRRAILARLSTGEASVQELAKPFSMSMPAISKHLKVLESAGLIIKGRQAQFRPCRLEVQPFKEAVDWLEEHRKEWEARFDRLDAYLQRLQSDTVETLLTNSSTSNDPTSNNPTFSDPTSNDPTSDEELS